MANKRLTDMTTGNATRHLLIFTLPMFLGNLVQQLYNMVDSLVVGNYVGANALAAIGTCASVNFLFFSLSAGLANGIGVIVSQFFGAHDDRQVRKTIGNSFYILAFTSLLTAILGILIARPLMQFMGAPAEIINDSVTYLQTTCCGILFIALYNDVAATLRALGDSRTPLYFLIMSSFVNIALDLLFVLNFNMGVFGVALATVISQAFSAVVSLIYARLKVPYFRLSREELQPDPAIIRRSFRIGIPISLQNSLIAISMMALQRVVNSFGPTVMAAYTISNKVDLVVSQLYGALSMAVTTFSGQNIGAGKPDRVREGMRKGMLIVFLYNLVMVPLVYFLSPVLVNAFVSEADAAVIEYGAQALKITSLCYFFLGCIYVPRAVMNGCGDAAFSMINGITEVVCRIAFSTLLTSIAAIGVWGIWWASGATWFTVAITVYLRYRSNVWVEKGLVRRTAQ